MFKTFHAYYYENVLAAFQDYRNRQTERSFGRSRDIRLAMIATEALFHLREHLPIIAKLTRSQVQAECPDYRILADTCNSSKHKKLTKPTSGNLPPCIDEANRIFELTATIFYEDELGEYVHHEKLVQVHLLDGTHRDILEVLTNVANFFEQHLKSKDVFADAKVFAYSDPYRFRNREESSGTKLAMEINQSVGFDQRMQFLRFNRISRKTEPVDLAGCIFRGGIYKPRFDYDLSITHNATGKIYTRTVPIEGTEAIEMHSFETDIERDAFAERLPAVVASMKEMIVEFVKTHPETVLKKTGG